MLSHGGILNNREGSTKLLKKIISNKPKFLTWLPLSHSYEHTVQFVHTSVIMVTMKKIRFISYNFFK